MNAAALSSTTQTSSTNQASSAAQISNSTSQIGEQNFLQLLVAEMQNQDPSSPLDPTQFMGQLAQFSTVEGINNLTGSSTQLEGAQLLGRNVTASIVQNGASTRVNGVVNGVQFQSDGVHLMVGPNNTNVPLTNVTEVQPIQTSATGSGG